jgi:hypothetical protein
MRKRRENTIVFGLFLVAAVVVAGLAHAHDVAVHQLEEEPPEALMDGAGWYGLGAAAAAAVPERPAAEYSPAAHCGLGYGLMQATHLH